MVTFYSLQESNFQSDDAPPAYRGRASGYAHGIIRSALPHNLGSVLH
jgi:hypothetical protein